MSITNHVRPCFPLHVIQDSGGFQLVSLSKFTTITEEGALFESPFTGEPTMLTVCTGHHPKRHNSGSLSRKKASQYNTQSGLTSSCNLTTWVSRILVQYHNTQQLYQVPSLAVGPRVAEAMERSVRWLDRCILQHEKSGKKQVQNLFAIVQGGLSPELRDQCLDEMIQRKDGVAGFAVGGLSGGEEKGKFAVNFVISLSHVRRCLLANVSIATSIFCIS